MAMFVPAQNAYRFYEDGAENTSTALGSQDTALTRNVNSDSNIQLRIRIQETGGTGGATTDDYQLQYSYAGAAFASVTTSTAVVKGFNSASLTDAGTTTQRLTNGTGSFVAGEISETGLVTDRQVTASNYMELLYSLTLVAADVTGGGQLTFRVLVNGATMTYNVTPTLNVQHAMTAVTGVAGTGAAGTLTATGKATASLTGVAGTGSPGTLSAAGEEGGGVSANIRAGIAVYPIGSIPIAGSLSEASGDVSADITGVAATGAVGTLTVSGKAVTSVTGVQGTGAVGTPTISGKAVTSVTGVAATGQVATVTVSGKANVTLTGVSATGAIGTPTISGKAVTSISGVTATGAVGTPTASGKAATPVTGVAGTGAAGTPTVSGKANTSVTGVVATGATGAPTVSGKASVSLSGNEATGQVGTLAADTAGNVTVALTGVQATGEVSTVTVAGAANFTVSGVAGTGTVGVLYIVAGSEEAQTEFVGDGIDKRHKSRERREQEVRRHREDLTAIVKRAFDRVHNPYKPITEKVEKKIAKAALAEMRRAEIELTLNQVIRLVKEYEAVKRADDDALALLLLAA